MNSMKRSTTLSMTTLAFLCLGIVLPASNAISQQKPIKELIVGTWTLDAVYDQLEDGKKNDTWGPGVKGIAVFDGTGHMAIQIIAADRSKTASTSPRTPVGQAIGYFGTYTIDEEAKNVTYHIERCTFPGWDGIERIVNIGFPDRKRIKYHWGDSDQRSDVGYLHPSSELQASRLMPD